MTITQIRDIAAAAIAVPVRAEIKGKTIARIVTKTKSVTFQQVKQLTRAVGSRRNAVVLAEKGHIVIELRFGHAIAATQEQLSEAGNFISLPSCSQTIDVPVGKAVENALKVMEALGDGTK